MRACCTLGIHQAFTSDNKPTGNAETERFPSTPEEKCYWLQEWTCPFHLVSAFTDGIDYYAELYFHSALADQSSKQMEQDYLNHPSTLLLDT